MTNVLDAYPFDAGPGANSGQTRWQKMGRIWAGNGVVPQTITGLGGELSSVYNSTQQTITVSPGACNINGTYGELAAQTTVNATGDGLLVARLDNTGDQILVQFNLGATQPIRTSSIIEIALAHLTSGVLSDLRNFVGPGTAAALVGEIKMFGGAALPAGWLACDGSAVSRLTYSALYAVVQNTWGSGDGATTFNLPDLRSRTPVGAGAGAGLSSRALGTRGGEENHTLSSAENGYHNHSGLVGTESAWHIHGGINSPGSGGNGPYGLNAGSMTGNTGSTISQRAAFLGDFQTGNQSAFHQHAIPVEGGQGHNNMQPWAAVMFIIKT